MRQGYVGDIIDELLNEVGADTARMSLLWSTDRLVTRDPDVMKHILATGFNDFAKGDAGRMRNAGFWGSGIFGADWDTWKFVSLLSLGIMPLLM